MILFILLTMLIPSICLPMGTTFTLPMSIYKTRYATPDLTTVTWQAMETVATESKNCNGQTVPLLAFNGTQDLLNQFINSNLACDDASNVGKAVLSGKLKGFINLLRAEINLKKGFFIGGKIAFSQYQLQNIHVYPLSSDNQPLTPKEIKQNPELEAYLPLFYKKVLHNGQPFEENICNVLCLTAGWAKNWQHFTHTDFINMSLQTGIQIPPFSLNTNCDEHKFKIPMYQYYNIGIPLEADLEFGFLNWLNVGLEGVVIFFINNTKTIPVNTTATHNTLFPTSYMTTQIHQNPFVYAHTYLEADELIPKTSFLCGLTYAKQFKTTYQPLDCTKYVCHTIPEYSLHKPWARATFNIEIQIDCTSIEPTKCSPRLKFLYIQPIYEQATFKTRLLGGELAIDISGNF